jgi:hypothetical protein
MDGEGAVLVRWLMNRKGVVVFSMVVVGRKGTLTKRVTSPASGRRGRRTRARTRARTRTRHGHQRRCSALPKSDDAETIGGRVRRGDGPTLTTDRPSEHRRGVRQQGEEEEESIKGEKEREDEAPDERGRGEGVGDG